MFLHLTTGEAKRFSAIDTIFFGLDGKSRGRGGGGGGKEAQCCAHALAFTNTLQRFDHRTSV